MRFRIPKSWYKREQKDATRDDDLPKPRCERKQKATAKATAKVDNELPSPYEEPISSSTLFPFYGEKSAPKFNHADRLGGSAIRFIGCGTIDEDYNLSCKVLIDNDTHVRGRIVTTDTVYIVGNARVSGEVQSGSRIIVMGDAVVTSLISAQDSIILHNAKVIGDVKSSNGHVSISGSCFVSGNVTAGTDVFVFDNAKLTGDVTAIGDILVWHSARITGEVATGGRVWALSQDARVTNYDGR